jgi:hypothetical protein
MDEEWENLKKKRKNDVEKEIKRRKGHLSSVDELNDPFPSYSQSLFPFVNIRTYSYLCVLFTELVFRFHYYSPFKTLIADYIEKCIKFLLSLSSVVSSLLKSQPQLPSSVFSQGVVGSSSLPFLMSIAKSLPEQIKGVKEDDADDSWVSPSSSRTLINSIIGLGCNTGTSSPTTATVVSCIPQDSTTAASSTSVSLPSTCVSIHVLRSLLVLADKSRDALVSYENSKQNKSEQKSNENSFE